MPPTTGPTPGTLTPRELSREGPSSLGGGLPTAETAHAGHLEHAEGLTWRVIGLALLLVTPFWAGVAMLVIYLR